MSKVVESSFEESVKEIENGKEQPLSRHEVENSPFTVVGNDIGGWVGTMGKYRLTEPVETLEKCKEEVSEITWNRLVQVFLLINKTEENE